MTLNDLIKILERGTGEILICESGVRYANTIHDKEFRKLIKEKFGKRGIWFIEAFELNDGFGGLKPYIYIELDVEEKK